MLVAWQNADIFSDFGMVQFQWSGKVYHHQPLSADSGESNLWVQSSGLFGRIIKNDVATQKGQPALVVQGVTQQRCFQMFMSYGHGSIDC